MERLRKDSDCGARREGFSAPPGDVVTGMRQFHPFLSTIMRSIAVLGCRVGDYIPLRHEVLFMPGK
jgi:hypothetical protein